MDGQTEGIDLMLNPGFASAVVVTSEGVMSDEDDELQRIYDNYQLVEQRRLGSKLDRDAWIMASRQVFAPSERQACYVCGKFKSIAQAHHVVPLTAQYDRGFVLPDNEHVWLCPNHHTMVHRYIPEDDRSMRPAAMRARSRTTTAFNDDLTMDEFERLLELMRRSTRSPE
jgi:predicted HNH restriction endonuclease